MKLASLNDGTPDGLPVVVSRDLSRCAPATTIIRDTAEALSDWEAVADRLRGLSARVEASRGEIWRFHEAQALAPVRIPFSGAPRQAALTPARSPVVADTGTGKWTASLSIAALHDTEGRVRLLLPLLSIAGVSGEASTHEVCSPVAITPDVWDEAVAPDHPLTARLHRMTEGEAEVRTKAIERLRKPPRQSGTGAEPAMIAATDVLISLPVRTGDRLRAILADARQRPVAGVIDITIDPPTPAMAPLGRTRPPLRSVR